MFGTIGINRRFASKQRVVTAPSVVDLDILNTLKAGAVRKMIDW